MTYKEYFLVTLLFCLFAYSSYSQVTENPKEDNSFTVNVNGIKGFHVGFFAGALFANNYSAEIYNGYGLDPNGNKNTFANSALYRKIYTENANGSVDNVTPALALSGKDQWNFQESDMPTEVKYKTAFDFGILFNYGITKTDGLLLNCNFAKLNVEGVFTITEKIKFQNQALGDSILYFPITGQEQRLMFQLGYMRILGSTDNLFNFVVEGGLAFNNAKYLKNVATINNLVLDLTTYIDPYNYNTYQPQVYSKFGYGAFAGLGVNLNSAKYIIQLMYNPSFERIGLGYDPKPKLQQSVGLRVYYNLNSL